MGKKPSTHSASFRRGNQPFRNVFGSLVGTLLIDTNILLRALQPSHPMHALAVRVLESLLIQAQVLTVAIQNMAEFWNVATRPIANNGLGFSIQETQQELARLERYFQVVSENHATYAVWKELLIDHNVSGVQVHDARLVAVMKVYGIKKILTFNTQDFVRFTEIEAVHPGTIV